MKPICVSAGLVTVEELLVGPVGFASSAFARPKSSSLTATIVTHFDIGWLQVAINDPLRVRRFEGVGHLLGNAKGLSAESFRR